MDHGYSIRILDLEETARRDVEHRLCEHLEGVPELSAAWLFGSFATGRPFRDVDVGVLGLPTRLLSSRFLSRLAQDLERLTGSPRLEIDLRDLRATPYHFQHEVLSGGRLLFSRDERWRIRYECEVLARHLDFKPARRYFEKRLLSRIPGDGIGR